MNEYMQKAPMYQQLQDLQGKMRGVEGRYAGTGGPGAPIQAQPAVMPRNPMQQLGGVGGLAALLGGQPQEQERPQVRPAQAPPPPGMD